MDKKDEILLRGCLDVPSVLDLNSELLEMYEFLKSIKNNIKNIYLNGMKLEEALMDARYFLDHFYKLHKIPIYRGLSLGKIFVEYTRKLHPYYLPLFEGEKNIWDSSILEKPSENIFGKKYISFVGIILPNPSSEITSSIYTHEIVHSQLDSLRGSILNYYNSEVISMFVELVHAYYLGEEEKILKQYEFRKRVETKLLIEDLDNYYKGELKKDYFEIIEDCKYIVSNLIAFNLFSKFYFGSDKIKNEMIFQVQKIFDGEITVEDYIKMFDSQYENSLDVKTLNKYFRR